ncbi:MAG: SPOR domain-containing protein [Paramuribaculum sp.]|nr:SPOR domain-containing protein [Paramuribaculum sp.]
MTRLTFLTVAFAVCAGTFAGNASDKDIVSSITADGVNTIVQPEALARLLRHVSAPVTALHEDEAQEETAPAANVSREKTAGYRVQVFSDNRPAAKGEARAKGRHIAERFPDMRTYVKYTSPYWRLRVGDFRTRREAEEAAEELRKAFPSYSNEIRVVQDRISVN